MSNSVTINIISAKILSVGINVGSFMYEYILGNKYQWIYSSSISGSSYQDIAYLDLGVLGTLLFNDVGSLIFTLNIGTSNQMALVYQRYNSPSITIPYELICMKRAW
ncbi:unnamed protein product [Rotaria sp. Silwood2]|nr:unnamed protein product [Rotaria sp. Silwood2]